MTESCSCAEVTAVVSGLEGHQDFLLAAQSFYAQDIVWVAPARGIRVVGREAVIAHQQREAASMWNPEFTFLRRSNNERQIIDEFAVRFVCTGNTIESAPVRNGDLVELKRLRILEVQSGRVVLETCIENWTVLESVE
jgi:hypothetical protein